MNTQEKQYLLDLVLNLDTTKDASGLALNPQDIADVTVVATNNTTSNSRINIQYVDGTTRQFEYSRESLSTAITDVLEVGSLHGSDVEELRASLIELGLAHDESEIEIEIIHAVTVALRTTDKSIRYYGELRLPIELKEDGDFYILSQPDNAEV